MTVESVFFKSILKSLFVTFGGVLQAPRYVEEYLVSPEREVGSPIRNMLYRPHVCDARPLPPPPAVEAYSQHILNQVRLDTMWRNKILPDSCLETCDKRICGGAMRQTSVYRAHCEDNAKHGVYIAALGDGLDHADLIASLRLKLWRGMAFRAMRFGRESGEANRLGQLALQASVDCLPGTLRAICGVLSIDPAKIDVKITQAFFTQARSLCLITVCSPAEFSFLSFCGVRR